MYTTDFYPNKDLIRAERSDSTKNISYHFLKQSLTGNEVVVAQMAKLERYRLYELPEDKIREDTKKHKCNFEDCWLTALPLTDYCTKHINQQSNQFLYPNPQVTKILKSDAIENNIGKPAKRSFSERKRIWKELSDKTDDSLITSQMLQRKITKFIPTSSGLAFVSSKIYQILLKNFK